MKFPILKKSVSKIGYTMLTMLPLKESCKNTTSKTGDLYKSKKKLKKIIFEEFIGNQKSHLSSPGFVW